MAAVVRRAARAKLNLYLHIQGRRADGYHTLESLVVFTDLADHLTFVAAPEITLAVHGPFAADAGATETNLVMKAAQRLQIIHGAAVGAAITLEKNIPVGAGLGGGSADAAATLHGLNQLWQLGLSAPQLQAHALALGADVAMCLASRPAVAQGVGEVLTPLGPPLPAGDAVLVYPRIPLLTAEVYRALALPAMGVSAVGLDATLHYETLAEMLHAHHAMRNDLEAPATALAPVVARVLAALKAASPPSSLVRMSGSGACCFALVADGQQAQHIATSIVRDYPEWWATAVKI